MNISQETPRRNFLKKSAVGSLLIGSFLQSCADDDSVVEPIDEGVQADSPYTSDQVQNLFDAYFEAKSAGDVDRTMRFFSENLLTYTDAVLGWDLAGFDSLRKLFIEYMPKWGPSARSYPTQIYGQTNRVVVDFVDSPELFGSEIRLLGIVDLVDGKIIRWADYWDGRTFPSGLYNQLRTVPLPTPIEVRQLPKQPAVNGLEQAFMRGEVGTIVAALATDAIFEDLTAKITIIGRAAIERFLKQTISQLPYGSGSQWTYPLPSGNISGGAEWKASPTWPGVQGLTAVGRNQQGEIERVSSIYDGRLCRDDQFVPLFAAGIKTNEG